MFCFFTLFLTGFGKSYASYARTGEVVSGVQDGEHFPVSHGVGKDAFFQVVHEVREEEEIHTHLHDGVAGPPSKQQDSSRTTHTGAGGVEG